VFLLYWRSAFATAFATLLNILAGVSVIAPFSFRRRYCFASSCIAFSDSPMSSLTPCIILNPYFCFFLASRYFFVGIFSFFSSSMRRSSMSCVVGRISSV